MQTHRDVGFTVCGQFLGTSEPSISEMTPFYPARANNTLERREQSGGGVAIVEASKFLMHALANDSMFFQS